MNDELENLHVHPRTLEVQSFCIDPYQKVIDPFIIPPTNALQDGQVSDFRCTDLHMIRAFDWRPREDIKPGARDETIVCVHGLFRNAHDFDFLARRLCAKGYRVVCPDMPGRGRSDDLKDPRCYTTAQYQVEISAILAAIGDRQVDWLGTSMGGVLGMVMAAEPNTPIRRLVMNDVGAGVVPRVARDYIATYACTDPHFANNEDGKNELAKYLMRVYSAWNLPIEEWNKIARVGYREIDKDTIRVALDPKLGQTLIGQLLELDRLEAAYAAGGKTPDQVSDAMNAALLAAWKKVTCPVLLIHGAKSAVLSDQLIKKMKDDAAELGHPLEVITIPECGHAPSLMTDKQAQMIEDWLKRTPRSRPEAATATPRSAEPAHA